MVQYVDEMCSTLSWKPIYKESKTWNVWHLETSKRTNVCFFALSGSRLKPTLMKLPVDIIVTTYGLFPQGISLTGAHTNGMHSVVCASSVVTWNGSLDFTRRIWRKLVKLLSRLFLIGNCVKRRMSKTNMEEFHRWFKRRNMKWSSKMKGTVIMSYLYFLVCMQLTYLISERL